MLRELKGLGKLAYNSFPTAMRVLSWNCRGLGTPSAVLQCQKKAQEYKSDIIFLMETKLEKDKRAAILEKCGFSHGWEVP